MCKCVVCACLVLGNGSYYFLCYFDLDNIIKNKICITVSLYYCITVLLYHCITVSLYHCITVSLYHCITVLMYHCISVSLYLIKRKIIKKYFKNNSISQLCLRMTPFYIWHLPRDQKDGRTIYIYI